MEKQLEILKRKILFNGREIKDGVFVKFNYGKKKKKYKGYFYIADIPNRIIGCDFLLSDCKREEWKFWSLDGGYSKGFKISKVYNFEIQKDVSIHPNLRK